MIGQGRYTSQSLDDVLRLMDESCVSKAIVCPNEELITVDNEEGNSLTISACGKHPGQLYGYAVANPWRSDASDVLTGALECGLHGVYFNGALQGLRVDDDILYPLVEVCERFDVPVYFHTGTPLYSLPLQVAYLARRYPGVRFILGHMGANDFVSDAFEAMVTPNLYLETSLNLTVTMKTAAEKWPERLLFGSGLPQSSIALELEKLSAAGANTPGVLGRNCKSLFKM